MSTYIYPKQNIIDGRGSIDISGNDDEGYKEIK